MICFLVLELGARGYVAVAESRITDHYEFRKLQPPPYKDAPYFSQEFLAESFQQPGGWYTPVGTRLVIPKNFSGKYFNTRNGQRVTTYQPTEYENTVYLLGGSTVYNSEVPDKYTIASQLQVLFSGEFHNKYRVENLGATSVNISQQVERLKTITLKEGDIVIFFDGANDVLQSIFFNNPNGWIVQENRQAVNDMPAYSQMILYLYGQLRDQSQLVKTFLSPFDLNSAPSHLEDEAIMADLLEQLGTNYTAKIIEAHQYSQEADVQFFHFLQPNLFTLSKRSAYEQELLDHYGNTHIIPAGLELAFARGYPVLKQAVIGISAQNINSNDISNILDDRQEGEEFYLDWVHVNHHGNQIIAEYIFREVVKNLPTKNGL
jgi:lysophospholipase L1-like esterase